jgi:hypothetical protein
MMNNFNYQYFPIRIDDDIFLVDKDGYMEVEDVCKAVLNGVEIEVDSSEKDGIIDIEVKGDERSK